MQGSCSKFLSGERGEGVGAKEERVDKISEGMLGNLYLISLNLYLISLKCRRISNYWTRLSHI